MSQHATICLSGQFESAHFLPHVPAEHRCRRLHGHTYGCEVEVTGPLHPQLGWVMDFGELETALNKVLGLIDHRLLNDIEGLHNPTSETLAHWLWEQLLPKVPALSAISVWENPRMRAVVRKLR